VKIEQQRLINAIGTSGPAQLLPHFIGRAGTEAELKALNNYAASQGIDTDERKAEMLGLILASPAFQSY
jgi:hypothetical protein